MRQELALPEADVVHGGGERGRATRSRAATRGIHGGDPRAARVLDHVRRERPGVHVGNVERRHRRKHVQHHRPVVAGPAVGGGLVSRRQPRKHGWGDRRGGGNTGEFAAGQQALVEHAGGVAGRANLRRGYASCRDAVRAEHSTDDARVRLLRSRAQAGRQAAPGERRDDVEHPRAQGGWTHALLHRDQQAGGAGYSRGDGGFLRARPAHPERARRLLRQAALPEPSLRARSALPHHRYRAPGAARKRLAVRGEARREEAIDNPQTMTHSDDDRLGLDAPISRRDFLNGTLVAGAGALLHTHLPSIEADDSWTGYGGVGEYRHSNGNTYDVMNVAHMMRDGMFERRIARATDTGEVYDLVV